MYDIPFVPSADDSVRALVKLAGVQKGDKVIDLGAGDGKLVMALAQSGADVTGVEIDEERAQQANEAIEGRHLARHARILRGNLWRQNLGDYDVIVLYGVPSIMERLSRKLLKEAKPTARVVSNHFTFPDWEPDVERDNVYRYLLESVREQSAAAV
jgi:16S rRNA A1518/A1519 N6-dimethyltransferase RsmA/KsgA/DIM1 with predicted DNA glycosylase/AP lyase activity